MELSFEIDTEKLYNDAKKASEYYYKIYDIEQKKEIIRIRNLRINGIFNPKNMWKYKHVWSEKRKTYEDECFETDIVYDSNRISRVKNISGKRI